MTKRALRATFLFATLALAGVHAYGQTPCGASHVPTAQERIAMRDIQARIDESLEADIAGDLEASARILAGDFTVKQLDGTVLDRRAFLAGSAQEKGHLLRIDERTKITVTCVKLAGPEATVYTDQHYVRFMPDRRDGSPHEVITNITHKETWVFTRDGWMVRHIEELEQGPTLLDGEPYTP